MRFWELLAALEGTLAPRARQELPKKHPLPLLCAATAEEEAEAEAEAEADAEAETETETETQAEAGADIENGRFLEALEASWELLGHLGLEIASKVSSKS